MKLGDTLKVTRDEIIDFPKDTIELILDLQKEGWRAQRSNRNHVMLLAPDGVTRYSASRNVSSAKYLAEDIRRYKAGEERQEPEKEEAEEVAFHEKFPCPQVDCPRSFASQKKVNVHLAVDHEGQLKCPDCDETRENKRKLSIHRTHAHGYVSPRKAQRKAQEARRKAEMQAHMEGSSKNHQGEIVETVDEALKSGFAGGADAAREAGKSAGRATQEYVDHVLDDLDQKMEEAGVKFDPRVITQILNERLPVTAYSDTSPVDYIVSSDGSALDLTTRIPLKATAQEVVDGIVKDVLEGKLPNGYKEDNEPLDFIDERDSWTLDLEPILDMDIRTVARVLHAAGLKLEMRSWVADKGN